ncbi:50S ribosomal protein L16 [Candidatus Micrarchaeota archaeon]|nr:50S ribosomal protein L16 [Candidatus Micrarchaeota archaeon]
MGLRPAKTIRRVGTQPWTRISQRRPRKSFVKGAPRPKVRQYDMGVDKRFDLEVDLVAQDAINLRDNAIEAARQMANKYMEKNLLANYFLKVMHYPHYVIREHGALGVAGADRISKGMKLAFGRPKGRMAPISRGDVVFRARCYSAGLQVVKDGLDRALRKMSGHYKIRVRDITKDSANLARSMEGVVFKKKEEEAPKPTAAEAAAAAPAEGAEKAAAPAEKGKPAAAPAKAEEKKK